MADISTADQFAALRRALALSESQFAAALGLTGEKAAQHAREIQRGARDAIGPINTVARYLAQAVDTEADASLASGIAAVLPRWLECGDAEAYDEASRGILMHTRYPRFYAVEFQPDEITADDVAELRTSGATITDLPAEIGAGWLIVLWIDLPVRDESRLVQRAAEIMIDTARRDLAGNY